MRGKNIRNFMMVSKCQRISVFLTHQPQRCEDKGKNGGLQLMRDVFTLY